MSTNIDVKKEIEINIQIDRIACNNCGADLEHEVTADRFGDLDIRVTPCKCVIEDKENE